MTLPPNFPNPPNHSDDGEDNDDTLPPEYRDNALEFTPGTRAFRSQALSSYIQDESVIQAVLNAMERDTTIMQWLVACLEMDPAYKGMLEVSFTLGVASASLNRPRPEPEDVLQALRLVGLEDVLS